jgi:hypothetical protein
MPWVTFKIFPLSTKKVLKSFCSRYILYIRLGNNLESVGGTNEMFTINQIKGAYQEAGKLENKNTTWVDPMGMWYQRQKPLTISELKVRKIIRALYLLGTRNYPCEEVTLDMVYGVDPVDFIRSIVN